MDINHIIDSPFRQLGRGVPESTALSIDGDETWSYADLRRRRDQFIAHLLDVGIQHGDRVGMVLSNSLDYVALYFAIARLGAVAVRLNFRLAPPELQFLIEDSGCSAVVFHSSHTDKVELTQRGGRAITWTCLSDDDTKVPVWAIEPDPGMHITDLSTIPGPRGEDPLMIMYTSGTTGRPKGSVWTHDNALWFSTIQTLQWGFSHRSVSLTTGPLYHAGAFECFILPALMNYGTGVIMSSGGMSADRIARTVEKAKVSLALLYSFLIYEILRLDDEQLKRFDSLQLIMSGGDPLEGWALDSLVTKLPAVQLNKGFGLTEGGAQSAVLPHTFARSHAETVGRPLPLTEIRVVDPNDIDVPPGEKGEVLVKAPSISGIYWNRPEASAETFFDGWCRTGDIGMITEDGFLTICGRSKDMIRSGGENIYPAEVEAVLSEHPDVSSVSVVGVPDSNYLEVGCAVVVPAGTEVLADELEASLRSFGRSRLAKYKCPRHYVFVEALPVSPSGKILKKQLREQYAVIGSPSSNSDYKESKPQ